MIYEITPVPKPRMTRSDKWNRRPCVERYFEYRDQVRAAGIEVPDGGACITFYMPIPAGLSKKKKAERLHQPHKIKPDLDNLIKGLLDAVTDEDCTVWSYCAAKYWAEKGAIEVAPNTKKEGTK